VLPAALVGVGVVVALGASGGGYEPTAWYPAALFLLALLAVTLLARPGRGRPPRAVVAALSLLAAYALWSHLSIAWADDQGAAVQGAGRALLYAVVFALFALWPLDSRSAWIVTGAFGLGVAGLGLVELLRLDAASEPAGFFIDRRLSEPVGYHNANVALWFIGFWPCLVLAARREVPAPLRAVGLAGAGLLLGLALMGQSRGWLFSLPVVLAFFVAVVPGRARVLVALALTGLAGLVMAGPVLDVHDGFTTGPELNELVGDAARTILLASGALAAIGLGLALLDRNVQPRPEMARAAGRAVGVLAAVAVVGAAAVWVARSGDPVDEVSDAWEEFKSGELPRQDESRFTGSLGSGRYDMWRVAWERFEEEPLTGIGADNFQQDYLQRGRTVERPVHPHSLEIRVLSQTGVVGAILLLGAVACAGAAAARARRRAPPAFAAPVAAAMTVFAYWLVHGSVDWFWEIPALGAGAFAMLGVAVAAAPRAEGGPDLAGGPRLSKRARAAALAGGGLCLVAAAVVLGVGWIAERHVDRALDIWRTAPDEARSELDSAADLNPFTSWPALVSGSIAIERGELQRARAAFQAALERNPREHYALLELGAIASELGDRRTALVRLRQAARLSPRDRITAATLRDVRRGRTVDTRELGRRILAAARLVSAPD
jgi:O-antigen ligase/polysaccharide polymerase Wzy-like membrane protein